jgi:hypothetical protein
VAAPRRGRPLGRRRRDPRTTAKVGQVIVTLCPTTPKVLMDLYSFGEDFRR